MVELTPQVAIVQGLAVIAAALYAIVGYKVSRRDVNEQDRGPLTGFVVWWYGLALLGLVGVLFEVGINLADHGMTVFRGVVYPLFAGIYVMIGGLVYYLLYLYTGKRSWVSWIVVYYLLQVILLVWLVESQGPYIGLNEAGENEVLFTDELPPGHPLSLGFSLGLLLPPLGAAIAYLALLIRLEDRTLRYRVLMVSAGFILWFTYSLLGTIIRASVGIDEAGFLGQLVGQLVGILAATMVLMAYFPPAWVRRRLGVERIPTREARGGAQP